MGPIGSISMYVFRQISTFMNIINIILIILISSQDGWKYRDNPNFKFVWYEDMIADLPNVIKELANFTGYEVIMLDRHPMAVS